MAIFPGDKPLKKGDKVTVEWLANVVFVNPKTGHVVIEIPEANPCDRGLRMSFTHDASKTQEAHAPHPSSYPYGGE